MMLSNLGSALQARFRHTGSSTDLDDAITASRKAVAATPTDHPNHAGYLSNLGSALQARFRHTGSGTDLNEAVSVSREAVAITPADHSDRAAMLSNLGNALRTRFERTGSGTDLNEAVAVSREAVASTPTDHPNRARYLSNLGGMLANRFERNGSPTDLDDAVTVSREAVAATPTDHPNRARYLSNLGNALANRFERNGSPPDLDDAVTVSRKAVAATPTDHPDHAAHLSNLGNTLWTRFECTGADTDLDEAVQGWSRACASTVAPATTRLIAARQWARATAEQWGPAAAVEAYTAALNLLPLLAWRGIDHQDQQHLLQTHAATLARDGAACAIAAGRLDLALELLEQGRGVYWSQLLGTRTDLTALHQVAPHLAAQLVDCRAVLEQPTTEYASDPIPGAAEARMRAASRFDELVDQVRALPPTALFPNPDTFLNPPAIHTLLPDVNQDPIVIVNISRWRCDALNLTHHGITTVELPDLSEEQVIDEAIRYLEALQDFERSRQSTADRLILEMAITTGLEWLWEHITAPILDTLGHSSTPTGIWPRLWWCLTGALTMLPLHAAGHHQTTNNVYDRVVSSYTPTVRALNHVRTRPESSHPPQILIVALPNTPGQSQLPGTTAEHDLLCTALAPAQRTVLTDAQATRAALLAQIGQHRWLHASCHGTQNLATPTAGGLLPHDWNSAGLITITDLTGPDHTSGGEFAFLSACKTAMGGVTNPDEAITVAAAMQHVGWRHVIGTLWSVWDDSAAAVTHDLYPHLLSNGGLDPTNAAHALHHTIRKLRDAHPERPSTWAPFIHTGP
ncbi:CHAT domain-containing protein [Micromonospora lupini]|uniref:CHAT domain-containing protein n=1 Tax=Micromonospora lupini str. Lupac 08 TaxID=1150864 RepID=I0L1Y1_9ACTN|nr:CHAT domain-containing protein [Micromonospora lupini]CCH17828.1 conserved hypothetical protein [Micromonospora lupini str. Lupac 08]